MTGIEEFEDLCRVIGVRDVADNAGSVRPLWAVASDILHARPPYSAVPYLEALSRCESVDSMYGADKARDLVLYALSNLRSWRHADAKGLRAELKAHLS